MQRPEVSGAVRHIYIYVIRRLKVKELEQGNENLKQDSRYVEEDWEEGDNNLAGALRQE
jgi:hypothetical protein